MIKIEEQVILTEEQLLNEIKEFIKEDSDDPKILATVKSLKCAAEQYIKNAGVKDSVSYDNALYKLIVQMLVSHWYENRNILVIGSISKEMEISFKSIILQLRNVV